MAQHTPLMAFKILLNPAKATRSNLDGIVYVTSRMDWYCALTEHLLDGDHIDQPFHSILPQLEVRVVALYKALLLYQMKSVCSYYRHQGLVFMRGLVSWDDWDADLKAVTEAEDTLQKDSNQYSNLYSTHALGRLKELSDERRSLLGDIYKTLRDFATAQNEARLNDTDRQCRWDLRVVDPRDDLMKIENNKDRLHGGAHEWIFKTTQYRAFTRWSKDPFCPAECRLLWIKGPAGTGKTMLMIGIIRELERKADFGTPNLSYFFFQNTNAALRNATAALRSLIWMLLVEQPHLVSHVRKKYDGAGPSLFRDGNSFFALSEIFQSMLGDSSFSPVYFIVDALDECDSTNAGLDEFIRLISTSLTLTNKVKWLVSSRPEVDVPVKLKALHADTHNPAISETLVEINAQSLKEPVNAYIDYKLATLKLKRGYNNEILAEVSNEVRRRAGNTFLWVALVFKVLENTYGECAFDKVKEMPPGLPQLYDHMMSRIEDVELVDPGHCKNVLGIVFLAFRPLSVPELAALCGLSISVSEVAIEMCGSFLTLVDGVVHLIHQSAKDYLEAKYKAKIQADGLSRGHGDMARRSINALSAGLKRNMYNLGFGFGSNDAPPDPDPLASLRYSCIFWADHLCSPTRQSLDIQHDLTDTGLVSRFFKERFLYWLESLSLLEELPHGASSIQKILNLAQVCYKVTPLTVYLPTYT